MNDCSNGVKLFSMELSESADKIYSLVSILQHVGDIRKNWLQII